MKPSEFQALQRTTTLAHKVGNDAMETRASIAKLQMGKSD
jgi:hypothetical protein